jgi:hypothetical protein
MKIHHPRVLAMVALQFGAGCLTSTLENGGEVGYRGVA